MLEFFMNFSSLLAPIFYRILYMSILGSIVGIVILIIKKFLDKKISPKWGYTMWLIVFILFLIPINRITVNTGSNYVISSIMDKMEEQFQNTLWNNDSKNMNLNDQDLSVQKNSMVGKDNEEQFELNHDKMQNTQNELNIHKNALLYKGIIPIIWLMGVFISAIIFIIGNIGMIIKIHSSKECMNKRIKDILLECQKKLRIKKKIGIKIQNSRKTPCIYGIGKPSILVSQEFLEKEDVIIKNVFMHELSHYKRKDMIANCFLMIILMLHWFNPLAWKIFKKIRQDIELATDEKALSKMNVEESKLYGRTLISLLETFESEEATVKMLCVLDDMRSMEKRITMVKKTKKLKKTNMVACILTMTITICISMTVTIRADNSLKEMESEKEDLRNQIIGTWELFAREEKDKEFLINSYGTGIMKYGGNLEFNEDGTFTKYIGIYSNADQKDMKGTYVIDKDTNSIILKTQNGDINIIKYTIEDNGENLLKQDYEEGTLNFKKQNILSNEEREKNNY